MAIKIITADERLQKPIHINIALFGPAGIGKTTQAKSLDPRTTLFVNLEAGDLALEGWPADFIQLNTWDEITMFASILRGPDHSMRPEQRYSQAFYDHALRTFSASQGKSPEEFLQWLAKYHTIYVDSITVAGRWAFNWAKGQPQAFSEKTGKPDIRGAYGLVGQEIVGWVTALQHTIDKSIIIVGGLEEKEDDYGRKNWVPLIEGSKAGKELPYIFDQVITMAKAPFVDGNEYLVLVCQRDNTWKYPAKDRSGRLSVVEAPDIGKLIEKIRVSARQDKMVTTIPANVGLASETQQQNV